MQPNGHTKQERLPVKRLAACLFPPSVDLAVDDDKCG